MGFFLSMMAFDEDSIVAQLRDARTQRAAFEKVVGQYGQSLYWQIRRMVTAHEDADDVLQNTFVKAWVNIGTFRGESKISTWLRRIAYNETLTFLSKRTPTVSLDLDNSSEEEEDSGGLTLANTLQSDAYFDGERAEALLQAAIALLPAKQKAVFNMKYYEGMRYEDMAEVTGTSVGALKASYHLAVKKIEDFMHRNE